jgi:hypothetical protein
MAGSCLRRSSQNERTDREKRIFRHGTCHGFLQTHWDHDPGDYRERMEREKWRAAQCVKPIHRRIGCGASWSARFLLDFCVSLLDSYFILGSSKRYWVVGS